MSYLDARLEFSDSQALTATATSTNVIDLDASQDIGVGEPMGVEFVANTALGGSSNPTLNVAIRTDGALTGVNLTAPNILVNKTLTAATLVAGYRFFIFIPSEFGAVERYLDVRYTLTGGSPTISLSTYLLWGKMTHRWIAHESGFSVSA